MEELKKEFQRKHFGLSGVSDRAFAVPQARWCCQPYTWMVYRFAVAIYLTIWFIVIMIYWGEPPYYNPPADTKAKWFIYVSNWTFLCLMTYFWISAVGTLIYHKNTKFKVSSHIGSSDEAVTLSPISEPAKDTPNGHHNQGLESDEPDQGHQSHNNTDSEKQESGLPSSQPVQTLSSYFKVAWLFQNMSFAGAFFVTLLFWVLDFDPATSTVTVFNLHIHGVNLIFVLVDQFLIASPYRILHFIYPSLMSLVYFTFTGIYYAAGGLNEYPPDPESGNTYLYKGSLDWGRSTTTTGIVMTTVVLIAAPLLHLVFYGFYRLRRYCGRCECCDGYIEV